MTAEPEPCRNDFLYLTKGSPGHQAYSMSTFTSSSVLRCTSHVFSINDLFTNCSLPSALQKQRGIPNLRAAIERRRRGREGIFAAEVDEAVRSSVDGAIKMYGSTSFSGETKCRARAHLPCACDNEGGGRGSRKGSMERVGEREIKAKREKEETKRRGQRSYTPWCQILPRDPAQSIHVRPTVIIAGIGKPHHQSMANHPSPRIYLSVSSGSSWIDTRPTRLPSSTPRATSRLEVCYQRDRRYRGKMTREDDLVPCAFLHPCALRSCVPGVIVLMRETEILGVLSDT